MEFAIHPVPPDLPYYWAGQPRMAAERPSLQVEPHGRRLQALPCCYWVGMVPCDGLAPVMRGPSPLQPIPWCESLHTPPRLAQGLNTLASPTD
jgi:hypothetical protein